MKRSKFKAIWIILALFLLTSIVAAQFTPQRNVPTVKRVQRPKFKQKDWDTVFFKNIFEDGFVGKRPPNLSPGTIQSAVVQNTKQNSSEQNDSHQNTTGKFSWSKFVDRTVIEDEVKRLQIELDQLVTTPNKYKSDNIKARIAFSMLAMLFGVIEKYDGEIRWKKDAPHARLALARAAANARTGSEQAYQNAKIQKTNLQQLVRGDNFPTDAKLTEWDWSANIDRGAIMEILDVRFLEKVKPMTANQADFRTNAEEVLHQASLIAMMGEILSRPEMDDADEDEYAKLAKSMANAASQIVQGTRVNDFGLVEKGVNAVGKSCSNCHDEWR
jgi:hypothetical protein